MISIIITAYKTKQYAKELINSIIPQIADCEILVGIDGEDIETATEYSKLLKPIPNTKLYLFKKVGTYIIRNTLSTLCKYENILFFDSDDIMQPFLISKITDKISYDKIKFNFTTFYHNKNDKKDKYKSGKFAKGCFFIKKSIFHKNKGFNAWECYADKEFHNRVNNINTYIFDEPMFLRREHSNNLTHSKNYGMKSTYRKSLKSKGVVIPKILTITDYKQIL